ncbi:MAG: DnaJ domain-containing protein [Spirochaetaceae bacterium]|nr:DnaJ domain-containing protein [Spirochaetaceae bacterium]
MELRRALTIFRLQKRIPIESLNSIFRELVKKYHPDKVREHPGWAHERMSEINDAYETLAEWLSHPPEEKKTAPTVKEARENPVRTDEELFRRETPAVSSVDRNIFYPVFNSFLNGLGVYYQYGLDNPAYRAEGVRRFRYREAFRTIQKARDKLEVYSKMKRHPVFLAASRFSRLTAAEIELGEPEYKERIKYRKFDDRFRLARRSFDDAVKEIFFPELIPKHLTGRAVSGIYACYTSFVLYLTVFTEGERRNAAILMTARYDALMDLLELRNNGILEF